MTMMLDLAGLVLQAATLVCILALLLILGERTRSRPSRRPVEYVDHDPASEVLDLGRHGRLTLSGVVDRRIPRALSLDGALDGLTVYEVWALTRAGWVQLVPDGDGSFASPLLGNETVRTLRLWVDAAVDRPDTGPARRAAPLLMQAAVILAPRQSAPSLPPTAAGASLKALRWVSEREQDVVVSGVLEEWTEACHAASRAGWVLGIPTGEALLGSWVRGVSNGSGDPGVAFASWFVGEIGKATRRGLVDRATVERREPVARLLFLAAGRLLRALEGSVELEASPPRAVGPRQRESWLVDEALATQLGNAPVNGLVQPVVVLRPALRRGGTVLLEGEVA